MLGKTRLRPYEIDRMTVTEIALACDQDTETPRPPARGQPVPTDPISREAWANRLRSMSLAERLEMARANR